MDLVEGASLRPSMAGTKMKGLPVLTASAGSPREEPIQRDACEVNIEGRAIVLLADDPDGTVREDQHFAIDGFASADLTGDRPSLPLVLAEEETKVITCGAGR